MYVHLLVCCLNKDLSLIVPYTEVALLLVNCRYEWASSGFRREVDENWALLGYYAASGNFLMTFRDNLSVPSSEVKNPIFFILRPWRWDPIGSPETSVRNYHYPLRNNSEDCCFHVFMNMLYSSGLKINSK